MLSLFLFCVPSSLSSQPILENLTYFQCSTVVVNAPKMKLKIFSAYTSTTPSEPTISVTVDADYKIISGGAQVIQPDVRIVENYPTSATTWMVKATTYAAAKSGNVTAFAIGLYDPDDEWDVVIDSQQSSTSNLPYVESSVPSGYLRTGGGARVIFPIDSGKMIFVCGSYPSDVDKWSAQGSEHSASSTGQIVAYSIGVKHRSAFLLPSCSIYSEETGPASHPTITVTRTEDVIIGGGALGTLPDSGSFYGNVLFTTAPFRQTTSGTGVSQNGKQWIAETRDHKVYFYANCTIFTIECPPEAIEYL